MRPLAAIAALSGALWAQAPGQPNQVQILADKVRLIAGESLPLSAVARDTQGNLVNNATFTWSLNPPTSVVSLSSSGMVIGRTLGMAVVRATTSNGAFVDMAVQVLPQQIVISPSDIDINIGDSVRFTATALDKDGKPVPGVNFTWSAVSAGVDTTPPNPYFRVDASGNVTGYYEGSAYLRATYIYSIAPNIGLPLVMEQRVLAETRVRVHGPRDYALRSLYSSGASRPPGAQLKYRPSVLWPAPDGSLYFNASLDGIANGLLQWKDGQIRPVLLSGGASTGVGNIVLDMGTHSISSSGDILTFEQTNDGNRVRRATDTGFKTVLVNNIPAAGVDFINGFSLTRHSLNALGQFVFRASYRDPATKVYYAGIFRGSGLSVNELLLSQSEPIAELPPGLYDVDGSRFGIDDNGTAYYAVNVPGQTVIYRHGDNGRAKLLALGDPFDGTTVTAYLGAPNASVASGFFVAPGGEFLIGVGLRDNRNVLARYPASGGKPELLTLNSGSCGILDHNPKFGTLLFAQLGNALRLAVWKSGAPQQLLTIGTSELAGSRIETFFSGGFGPNGEIYILARMADARVIAAEVSPEAKILFQTGDRLDFPVEPTLSTFAGAARTGPVRVMAGGTGSNLSVFELAGGAFRPTLTVGDTIGRNSIFSGASTATYTRTSGGQAYLIVPFVGGTHDTGIARLRPDGSSELLYAFNLAIDGVNYSVPYRVLANDQGDILWQTGTSRGDQRLVLTHNGQHRVLATNNADPATPTVIGGQTLFAIDNAVMDDNGRVLATGRFGDRPNSVLLAWNGSSWTYLLTALASTFNGRQVTSFSAIRAAGSHLMVLLQLDGSASAVAEWTDDGLATRVRTTDVSPLGYINGFIAAFDVNRGGDVAFVSGSGDGQGIFLKRGDKTYVVTSTNRPTDDGELLRNVSAIEVRDDGTVYMLTPNISSDILLLEGTPKF